MSGNSSIVLTAATVDPMVRDSADAEPDAPVSGTRPSDARAPAPVQARIDSFFDGLEPVFVIDSPPHERASDSAGTPRTPGVRRSPKTRIPRAA